MKESLNRVNLSKEANLTKQAKNKCLAENQNLKLKYHKSTLKMIKIFESHPTFLSVYI